MVKLSINQTIAVVLEIIKQQNPAYNFEPGIL